MTRGPRYTDSKDFDEIHDEITIWVMKNYSAINAQLIEKEFADRHNMLVAKHPIYQGRMEILSEGIKIEEQFYDFYPDAKIEGEIGIHHDGNLILNFSKRRGSESGEFLIGLTCPKCWNSMELNRIKDYEMHYRYKEGEDIRNVLDTALKLTGLQDIILREEDNKIISNRTWKQDYFCHHLYFKNIIEIKSHIKSFGEVMRQLQSYRVALERWKSDLSDTDDYHGYHKDMKKLGQVVLITPDTRFNEYFEKQGFTVITYKRDSGLKSLDYFDNNQKLTVDPSEIGQDLDLKEKGGASND